MVYSILDRYFDDASAVIGLPEDQLKVVFCWIICIPLGFVMKFMTNPFIRNLYGLSLGLFLQFLCIREYMYLILFSVIVVYIMAKTLDKKCDWPSFAFLYSLLLACHIYRYFTDYYGWKIDGSACLMIMLCKMTYFTFGYCDGKVQMPSFLDYMGYLFFFPSAIIGPVFSLQTYTKFIYLQDQYAKIPNSIVPTLKQVMFGCLYLGILQGFSSVLDPKIIFKSEWYIELNWFLKTLVWHPMIFWVQIRYLGAWKFAQAGMHSCGISYAGEKDENGNQIQKGKEFDAIITVHDSYLLEFNPQAVIKKWNKSVQTWLGEVFFTRFYKVYKINASTSLLLVFAISAVWHGVHPMYFISFIHFMVYNDIAKFIFKANNNGYLNFIPKQVKTILGWYLGKTAVNYFGIGFNVLEVSKVMEIYSTVYYSFTIVPLIVYLFFTVTGYGQRPPKSKAGAGKESAKQNTPQQEDKKNM